MAIINWYMAQINYTNGDNNLEELSIKGTIFNEFNVRVNENSGYFEKIKFVSANNNDNKFTCVNDGNVSVVGDIQIHNKSQIIERFNLTNSISTYEPNEKLIILLYKEIGMEFARELVGEFAFVIHDCLQNKVYAVRDHLGKKTLFYCRNKESLLLASDIFILKNFFDIKQLEYRYFEEYYIRNGIIDIELTPYLNVFRIPSGAYLELTKNKSKMQKYWELSKVSGILKYKTESDYYEEFTKLLNVAVQDRLVPGKKNAVMLSGGLDSTSIYALSKSNENKDRNLLVKPVSAVFDELKDCDEREYIVELLHKYQDEGIFVNCDNELMFDNFPGSNPFSYEPNVNSISYNFTYATVKASVSNGLDNILSGYAGDHLLTGSLFVTRDLLKKGRVKEVVNYLTNWSMKTNTSAVKNLLDYTLFPNITRKYVVQDNGDYFNTMKQQQQNIASFHQKELFFQISNAKSHLYTDRVIGAIAGADINHPFLDRRLVEFVYKIPGNLTYSDAETKYILRRSMHPYLTDKIVNRINKTTHLAYIYKSIRNNWDKILEKLFEPKIISKLNLIALAEWKEELVKWRNGVKVRDGFWTLFAIELWFIKYEQNIINNKNHKV